MIGYVDEMSLNGYDQLSPEIKQMFRERDLNFHFKLWQQVVNLYDDPIEQIDAYQAAWRKIEFDLLVQSWKPNK